MIPTTNLFRQGMNQGMGMGRRRPGMKGAGRHGVFNAPTFAWSVYHNDSNPPWIPGRPGSHASVQWNGIDIDKQIPLNIVKELNSIPGIQVTASCQGHNESDIPDVNTYMIFLPKTQDENYVKILVSKLNKNKDIKSGYGEGAMGRFRVAVVAPFSFDSNPIEFKKWWINLPKIIKKAL